MQSCQEIAKSYQKRNIKISHLIAVKMTRIHRLFLHLWNYLNVIENNVKVECLRKYKLLGNWARLFSFFQNISVGILDVSIWVLLHTKNATLLQSPRPCTTHLWSWISFQQIDSHVDDLQFPSCCLSSEVLDPSRHLIKKMTSFTRWFMSFKVNLCIALVADANRSFPLEYTTSQLIDCMKQIFVAKEWRLLWIVDDSEELSHGSATGVAFTSPLTTIPISLDVHELKSLANSAAVNARRSLSSIAYRSTFQIAWRRHENWLVWGQHSTE